MAVGVEGTCTARRAPDGRRHFFGMSDGMTGSREAPKGGWFGWVLCMLLMGLALGYEENEVQKRAYLDNSIDDYFSERTCWWNEVCKREFQVRFRCRCPRWSFCRSPGRYYDAFCSITRTGYIWIQHESDPND